MKIFFLIIFLSFRVISSPVEAPYLAPDYQQNPSQLKWKHIVSEHFDIIFPEGVEREALRVSELLEHAYPYVTRSLEVAPPRIPLILQNQSVVSNGFVTLAPRRSEWFLTPTIDPELSNTDWLKTLAIHEFRHVAQFQKTRRGFNKVLEVFLGEIGQAVGVGLTLPPWFLEGDAVGIETALTRGGRGRLPLFDRDLRTVLLSGKEWSYDKAHLRSYEDYVPNHYVYGYFYTSWLRNKYGDLILSTLANHSAETSWNPLTFYNSVEELTAQPFETFYTNVMSDLKREWSKRVEKLELTPYSDLSPKKNDGWTNYYYPQLTIDGNIVALKRGLSFIDQFVMIKGQKEELLFYPGPINNEYPFKMRGNKIVFFEWEFDSRWGRRDYSRLKVYDLHKKEFVLDRRKTKGRLAIPDHLGERIIFVEWDENQGQKLVIMNLKGEIISKIPYPENKVITGLDWISENEVVLVVKNHSDQKSIVSLNLFSNEEKVLVKERYTNIGFVTSENGHIFFEGPDSGIDNIWYVSKNGPIQITSSKFGAYSPTFFKNELYYNDYSVDGMNIVKKDISWDNEQASQDSFYPIYEKYSRDEKFSEFETSLIKKTKSKIEGYSQVKNSLNFHSWIILAPPLSQSISLSALSRDVLNTFFLTAGGEYNLNEQTTSGFVSATWSHYFPVFDLRAIYGKRRQQVDKIEDEWEEGSLEAGISIPWKFIHNRFINNFTIRAFSRVIQVTNKITDNYSEIKDGALYSPGLNASYSFLQRMSRRDINPPWGISINSRVENGQSLSGKKLEGHLQSYDTRFYLPGLFYHHSFYHQFAYERQKDNSYQYSSLILYPRGTKSLFLEEFTKYSANYLLPLFYPDWSASSYLYLKRISLNLFYDELNGSLKNDHYRAASTGWEGFFEMNFFRLFIPLNIGLRGSYVLEGIDKKNNYEVFLSTLVETM